MSPPIRSPRSGIREGVPCPVPPENDVQISVSLEVNDEDHPGARFFANETILAWKQRWYAKSVSGEVPPVRDMILSFGGQLLPDEDTPEQHSIAEDAAMRLRYIGTRVMIEGQEACCAGPSDKTLGGLAIRLWSEKKIELPAGDIQAWVDGQETSISMEVGKLKPDTMVSFSTALDAVPPATIKLSCSGPTVEGEEVRYLLEDNHEANNTHRTSKWNIGASNGWVQMDLSRPVRLHQYALKTANDFPGRDPKDFTLVAYRANGEEVQLHENKGGMFCCHSCMPLTTFLCCMFPWPCACRCIGRWQWVSFPVKSTEEAFSRFRLRIDSNHCDCCTQLGQLKLYEARQAPGTVPTPVD